MDYAGLQVHIWLLPAIFAFFLLLFVVPLLAQVILNSKLKKEHKKAEVIRKLEHEERNKADVARGYRPSEYYPIIFRGKYEWLDGFYFVGAIGGIIFAVVSAIALIPYNGTYYSYYSVTGNITSVSNQFISGTGDSTTTGYTLKLDKTGPRVLSTDDSRITQFHKGDKIDLTCTVEWVYQGQDKTNCFVRSY